VSRRRAAAVAFLLASVWPLRAESPQASGAVSASDGTIAVGLACGDGTFVPLAARTKGRWTGLISMVRLRTDDDEWYFFQAQKQSGEWYVFEGQRMYRNWARVLVHGWVRVSIAGMSTFPEKGSFDDDVSKMGRSYRLAGVLVLDDRVVWITEGVGYEWQWYELFETGPRTRPHSVLSVDTGRA
jgi:hypothetical protein